MWQEKYQSLKLKFVFKITIWSDLDNESDTSHEKKYSAVLNGLKQKIKKQLTTEKIVNITMTFTIFLKCNYFYQEIRLLI